MVLTIEIGAATLNSFSAAAECKEKIYLADPSKGLPFRLDGKWQTFAIQDMRMEDLCREFNIEALCQAWGPKLGAPPCRAPGAPGGPPPRPLASRTSPAKAPKRFQHELRIANVFFSNMLISLL